MVLETIQKKWIIIACSFPSVQPFYLTHCHSIPGKPIQKLGLSLLLCFVPATSHWLTISRLKCKCMNLIIGLLTYKSMPMLVYHIDVEVRNLKSRFVSQVFCCFAVRGVAE